MDELAFHNHMRICVINPGVVHAIPRTLAIAPHFDEVHYIDMRNSPDASLEGMGNITVHAPFSEGQSAQGGLRLQRLLREIEPDGIVCFYAAGLHLFGSILYNRCPVSAVAMGHDVLYDKGDCNVSSVLRLLIRMALRRTDFISAKSRFLEKRIRSYGYTGEMDVNYWGAKLDSFRPAPKKQARNELDLPQDRKIILSPRAVEPRLNIDLIVRAMLKIKERVPDALLVVLGRYKRDYRDNIERFIRDNNLVTDVRLVYEVGQDVLPAYYNASDVVVSMASSEGFPNTLLEVMACEVPIVAGRIPQIEELLVDSRNARLCGIDVDEIATCTGDVLSDPGAYATIVENAKRTLETHGDLMVNGKRFADNFSRIIKQHKASRISALSIFRFFLSYVGFLIYRKIMLG